MVVRLLCCLEGAYKIICPRHCLREELELCLIVCWSSGRAAPAKTERTAFNSVTSVEPPAQQPPSHTELPNRSRLRAIVRTQALRVQEERNIWKRQAYFRTRYTLQYSLGHGSPVSRFEELTLSPVVLWVFTGQYRLRSLKRSILRLWGTTSDGRVMVKSYCPPIAVTLPHMHL